jgi:hypothetical protein
MRGVYDLRRVTAHDAGQAKFQLVTPSPPGPGGSRFPRWRAGWRGGVRGQASLGGVVLGVGRGRVGRGRIMQTADLNDLHAEGLQPGQEPVQGRLIPQGTVQYRFDRLHRSVKALEVEQGFGREDPDDADLVVGRRQSSPQHVAMGKARTPPSRFLGCAAPCTAGESVTRPSGD